MSEPEAGSDLAAVQTRAARASGGWSLTGTKLWTGGAHENDWCVVLCRTSEEDDRHRGLTQVILDLHAPGVSVRPIAYLDGSEFFNEVVLDRVFVADELVIGEVGSGWAQNTSELAYERSGPERWLSTYLVLEQYLREHGASDERAQAAIGEAVAGWWGIRTLSLSVARLLDAYDAVRAFLAETPPTQVRPPRLLSGDDLKDLGYTPGPEFQKILSTLEDAQLEEAVLTRDQALEFVRRNYPLRQVGR